MTEGTSGGSSLLPDRVSAAMAADSMDAIGLRDQVMRGRFWSPWHEAKAVGRARTLRFGPASASAGDDPYRGAIDFIDSLLPGDLVVISTDESDLSAVWGELFSAAALGRGAAGMVTDGFVRDVAGIRRMRFPAFGAGALPVDYRDRQEIVSVDQPVVIRGLEVCTGDIVVADQDGTAIIPFAVQDQVTGLMRTRASKESSVMDDLIHGQTLSGVWDRHRIL
jgi:4-hydroxy-4-methyl-2-oxoglutarate aldolase